MSKTTILITAALIASILFMPSHSSSADFPADVQAIIDHVDRLFRSNNSSAKMEMTIKTPDWSRTLTIDVWTEGLDKTFARIKEPKKDAGIATLRIDNEMWNYFPKINKVMKVPPSMMMSSWMGSDFTNDDLVKESSMTRDYTGRLISAEEAGAAVGGEHKMIYVELVPKEDLPIVWGKIVIAVRASDYMPLQQDFYDERGTKMRVMNLYDIKPLGGRTIPNTMELIPLNKEGHSTIVHYREAEFDRKLPADVFSLRNLQSQH